MLKLKIVFFLLPLLLFPIFVKPAASSGVIFNEILPSPEGQDAKEEWIELLNSSDYAIDMTGWRVTDTEGSVKSYTFPKNTQIPGQGYLILARPNTKITLNNDSDGLQLINEGVVFETVEYVKAPKGQSYNRTESGWVWSKNLTPGSKNIISTLREEKAESKTDAQTKTGKTSSIETPEEKKKIAAISEQIPKPSRSLYFFLTAFLLAVFSSAVILFLKKNLV